MTTSQDTSRIAISFDPRRQRMSGFTAHKHMFFDVPFITEVAPNLWQGGCESGLILPTVIKHLLSLYKWEAYDVNHKLRTQHTIEMYDSLDQATDQIDRWARWVNARRRTGPVLVHCQAGLNRSGLVTARALMYDGMTADAAIALLREKRSPAVLCNQAFEDYLRSI
jgi:protein-tyrosine phosphatase